MRRPGIRNRLRRRLSITTAAHYYTQLKWPGIFDDVAAYCVFVGHGRSGSTLVGALLNAHPDIVLSNELDALSFLDRDLSRGQLFRLIFYQARRQARQGSMGGGGYTYAVPGQWQGRHRTIRVIGDRKSGATALHLANQPDLIWRLGELVTVPMKFISVVRNPFDTLTTTFEKTPREPHENEDSHLRREIELYFSRTSAIRKLCDDFGEQSIRFVHHEQLISKTKSTLADLCAFLGVDADDKYLDDCASIVRSSPSVTRRKITWTDDHIELVMQKVVHFPWLKNYSFTSE